jgi:syntaxin-binding protein 1
MLSEFLEAIRSVNPPGKWKILVVDEFSQKLLGSVLKQFDILEENVTCTSVYTYHRCRLVRFILHCSVIELITNNREPQPGFEAVYLLMPTSQNVDRIIRDFSNGTPQYAAGHLFFLEGCKVTLDHFGRGTDPNSQGLDEPLFQRLFSSAAEPSLKGLRELFLNFWGTSCFKPADSVVTCASPATEAQAFSLQDPGLFFSLFSPPRSDGSFKHARARLEEDLKFVSKAVGITAFC